MTIKNQTQLITYPDSIGGNLAALEHFLAEHGAAICPGGVHILPPFPSSGDRGFAPLTYTEIEPRFGTWEDVRRIAQRFDVALDLMVNHISRRSPYFQDFAQHGRGSRYAGLFITLDKIWPGGQPPAEDIARIFLRKPEHPFSTIIVEDTGQPEVIWTTFGKRDWSEQIDLDVHSAATRDLLVNYLRFFARQGVKIVRLDAVGYVIKKPGTRCFMVEPEIYEFMDWLVAEANVLDIELLPEVHDHYRTQERLAAHGYWVYDFVLPGLILHTLLSGVGEGLKTYLKTCPRRQFTMLDCHDGIPMLPDLEDVLTAPQMQAVVNTCLARGANLSRILSADGGEGGFDVHQINCTYYSALGEDDGAYLAARCLQLFAPGVPQIYYAGLLASANDLPAVAAAGDGRAINRHNYTLDEAEAALQRPVVRRLLALLALRNSHPAFNGELHVLDSPCDEIGLRWQSGSQSCALRLHLPTQRATVTYTTAGGRSREMRL